MKRLLFTRATLCLLVLCAAMLLFSCTIPQPPDPYQHEVDAQKVSLALELYQIRQLYEAAGEGEEAFNAKLTELAPWAKCTRDQFLTAYDTFSKQIVLSPQKVRLQHRNISFEYVGTTRSVMDGDSYELSVNTVSQMYSHRYVDGNYAGFEFYGSVARDPKDWENVDSAFQYQKEMGKGGYTLKVYADNEETPWAYYIEVYKGDTYIGILHIYNVTAGFLWTDLDGLEFMTLEQAIQNAQPPNYNK
jgi:hypothetical protein